MAEMLCQEDSSLSPGWWKETKKKGICQRSSKGIVSGGSLLSDVFFKEHWKFLKFFLPSKITWELNLSLKKIKIKDLKKSHHSIQYT